MATSSSARKNYLSSSLATRGVRTPPPTKACISNPACPDPYFIKQLKKSLSKWMCSHVWFLEAQHPQLAFNATQPSNPYFIKQLKKSCQSGRAHTFGFWRFSIPSWHLMLLSQALENFLRRHRCFSFKPDSLRTVEQAGRSGRPHTHTFCYPSCIYSLYIHQSLLFNCAPSSMMALDHRSTVLLVSIFALVCFTHGFLLRVLLVGKLSAVGVSCPSFFFFVLWLLIYVMQLH
jgi:hypothetical protein